MVNNAELSVGFIFALVPQFHVKVGEHEFVNEPLIRSLFKVSIRDILLTAPFVKLQRSTTIVVYVGKRLIFW